MSKILPASINLKPRDKDDLILQLTVSNHVLMQVLMNEISDVLAKDRKIPVQKMKDQINGKLSEATTILLSEIDALYGG